MLSAFNIAACSVLCEREREGAAAHAVAVTYIWNCLLRGVDIHDIKAAFLSEMSVLQRGFVVC